MKVLMFWLALLMVFCGSMTVWLGWRLYQHHQHPPAAFSLHVMGAEPSEPIPLSIGEFTLTERSSREFQSQELDGQVRVVSFFFISCPSICRLQNQKVKELHDQFGPQGVTFLSITCDPETDTPEALASYAELFHAHPEHWLFLTGDLEEIQRVGEMFQVAVNKQTHSERLMVIDRAGKIRGRYHWSEPGELAEMKRMLAQLLAEEAPLEATAANEAASGGEQAWLTEFTLTERSGKSFHSQELAGHVYVTSFFFVSCPSVCRLQNQKVKELHDEFGPRGVRFVSITCDPQTDTPEALARYAKQFNAHPEHWLFLTGDLTYIRRVGAEVFRVPVDQQAHSEALIVVDRQGEIRGRYHWNDPAEMAEMKRFLNRLLAEIA